MGSREYDAFGPWIFEITEEHPLPGIFKGYFDLSYNWTMLIKIPVNEERRLLKPGMNMYDYVIGALDDKIIIAHRIKDSVEMNEIRCSEILAIKNEINLLYGMLNIYTDESVFEIQYNAISEEIVQNLVRIIRKNLSVNEGELQIDGLDRKDVNLSFFYNNILKRFKKNEDNLKIVTYQKEKVLQYRKNNILTKFLRLFFKYVLLESLYLSNTFEIIVIERGLGIDKMGRTNYGTVYYYLPCFSILDVTVKPHKKFKDTDELKVKIGKYVFNLFVASGNKGIKNILLH